MEWLTGSGGLASGRVRWLLRLAGEALGKYITIYIVLTMRRRPPHPTVVGISWARERQREWHRFRARLRVWLRPPEPTVPGGRAGR
jgi:hypothetical protein